MVRLGFIHMSNHQSIHFLPLIPYKMSKQEKEARWILNHLLFVELHENVLDVLSRGHLWKQLTAAGGKKGNQKKSDLSHLSL